MLQQRQARRGRLQIISTMKKSQRPENLLLKKHRMRFWPSDLAQRRLGFWDWPAPPPGTRPRRTRRQPHRLPACAADVQPPPATQPTRRRPAILTFAQLVVAFD